MLHYQKLASYYVCNCWKDNFFAYFDVRLAHAGTSFVFSYLVFHHFNFVCASLRAISLSIPPKPLLLFSTKNYSQFSTLQSVADLGLLQHLKWSFFVTAVMTRNHWLLSQIVPPYMLQVTGGGECSLFVICC